MEWIITWILWMNVCYGDKGIQKMNNESKLNTGETGTVKMQYGIENVAEESHIANRTSKSSTSDLCYVILDALNAEDNLVPALSEQTKAGELRNSRYVYVSDGITKYFGQIEKGPIFTPEWGAVGDGQTQKQY